MTSANGDRRPRVLFVGRTRYRLPLPSWLAKKWDALERQLDYRVVASAQDGTERLEDGRFRLLPPLKPRFLDGALFYLRCPVAVRRQIRDFRPEAIVAESPYTAAAALLGRALAPTRPRIVVEVHGDWRTATRLYGSPRRRVLSPLADAVSRVALRRGDAVRAVSPYTGGLVEDVRGLPVTATFPTYADLMAFAGRPPEPLPDRPVALFVGMLEYYKNVDGLVEAWRRVTVRLPDARLVIVGKGSRRELVERLAADFPDRVEWFEELSPEEVAEKLDAATIFVLPSRSEGLPRVLMEAFARGRGAVGGRAGGIPELVRDGETGLLVDPEDVEGLAEALTTTLSDRELAERLGRAAHELYASVHTTPAEYASRVRDLVEASLRDGFRVGDKPRVLFVGSGGPEDVALQALKEELEVSQLTRSGRPLPFLVGLPFRVRARVRRIRPDVVVAESPYIGFLVLLGLVLRRHDRPSLVVETYGDWRTAARVGGSRLRVLLAPLADWAARYALRHADALRAVSPFTAGLAERAAGVPPVESFPGYVDMAAFTERPPAAFPETPAALFVGMLERSKDLESLTRAWPLVAREVPGARLVVVGRGALVDLVERLRDDFPETVEHVSELPPSGVSERMDASTLLVLPSRSEGLGRVILESFARGRPVVASRVGGIPDLVRDRENGLLVEPGDAEGLAAAMVGLMKDRALAKRLGAAALEAAGALRWTPDDYAARVRTLVDRTLSAAGR